MWWPARDIVAASLDGRAAVHASGQIVKLTGFCPWKEHLYEMEEEKVGVCACGGGGGEKVRGA